MHIAKPVPTQVKTLATDAPSHMGGGIGSHAFTCMSCEEGRCTSDAYLWQ